MKKMKYMQRRLLGAAVAGCLLLSACGEKETETTTAETETVLTVSVAPPEVMTLSTQSRFIGTVEADSTVYVIPKVSAEVLEKHFEVGDHVQEGDLLFIMDDSLAQISLSQAQAGLSSAQAGLSAAQAGYQAQEAAIAAQQAGIVAQEAQADVARISAAETMGTMDSNEQKLQMAVDNAETQVQQARLGAGSATDAYYFAQEQLDKALEMYNDWDNKATAAVMMQYPTRSSFKTQVDSLELQKDNAYRQMINAKDACDIAQEALESAKQALADYQNYTKNTIAASTEAQIIGVDQQLEAGAAQLDAANSQLQATGANIQASRAGISQAEAAIQNAETALSYYTVTSPVSGTIQAIGISEHNMATPSQPAYTIQLDEPGKVVFYVAEKTMREIQVGNEAVMERDGVSFSGKIVSVSDIVDAQQGLYRIEAQASDGSALPPSGSSISILTASRRSENALAVPADSIYYDGEQAYVYVQDGNAARRRNISCGLMESDRVEVTDGLSAGDSVIISWNSNMKDGAEIQIK